MQEKEIGKCLKCNNLYENMTHCPSPSCDYHYLGYTLASRLVRIDGLQDDNWSWHDNIVWRS